MGIKNMDIPFILLHVSTLLSFVLFILILRIKDKKALQKYFIFAVLVIFLWCALWLIRQYMMPIDKNADLIFKNCFNTLNFFLSILLFFIGYDFSKSGSKINPKIYLLFIVPCICTILVWTNRIHHLFYLYYSDAESKFIPGPIAQAINFIDYGFIIVGLFFLIRFSIKNAGFFSRQSVLIILGTLVPFVTDVGIYAKLFPVPQYFDAIAFSVTVLCFLIAMFRFDLFTVMPIALQTIVDHISDSYLVLNENGEISDYNRPFAEKFKAIASIKRKVSFEKLFSDKVSGKTTEIISMVINAIRSQRLGSFEIHIDEQNFDKYFIVEITPVVSNGVVTCTIALFKDITVQKRDAELIAKTQMMLVESEHLASLGQLVGGIAHNLKTPIMSISGGLEGLTDLIDEYDDAIGDESVTAEDHHEIAEEMRGWIRKMREYSAYMSDIITTVKGQAVQLTASTTDSFTLQELVKRVEILMNHELKRYSCKLKVNCQPGMGVSVKGEINSFVQVVNNLIINAIDAYEGRAGVIEFNISRDDKEEQMILFEVRDFGSGMTEEVKNKLFKEMITTKAKNGTGLGLYMSYSTITGRFGGKMWVHSVHGMGTSFYIMIPAI
jgi:signal transduction histidine kinase